MGQPGTFLGHIGEHDIEGVYDLRAGDNLGWSEREGSWVFDPEDSYCPKRTDGSGG